MTSKSHERAGATTIVVLGTGGTIAGLAASPDDDIGYRSAQVEVGTLVAGLAPRGLAIESEQVAQLDSKDMDFATWHRLATRVEHHLARPEVLGIVVTHGTDTMEETAYFLQRVVTATKPVVLTGAMRPASSAADGPRNLADAFATVQADGARGVVVAFAGRVHAGVSLRKVHPRRLDPFSSGDAGPVAVFENGRLQRLRDWPASHGSGVECLGRDAAHWPTVEIIVSVAGTHGIAVEAMRRAGVDGLVVAATGNGTLHRALEAKLREAATAGLPVLVATRCGDGAIVSSGPDDPSSPLPSAGALTPVQARVELMLRLLERQHVA